MTTREAIREMHRRGFDGESIIVIARLNTIGGGTPAQALVQHVKHTPNVRFCPNCHSPHYIQQCGEIRAAMAGASNGFVGRFKEDTTR